MCSNYLLTKKYIRRTLVPIPSLVHSKRKGIFIHPTAMFKNYGVSVLRPLRI